MSPVTYAFSGALNIVVSWYQTKNHENWYSTIINEFTRTA